MGAITIWTVLATIAGDHLESDFGLSPGGRLKLVKSAVLSPSSGSLRKQGGYVMLCSSSKVFSLKELVCSSVSLKRANTHSFCLANSHGRPLDFYIGTDSGYILHTVRHENKSGPSIYKPELGVRNIL